MRKARAPQRVILAGLLILLLGGCAHHYTSAAVADPYAFWSGIWHGVIFPYAVFANIASWLAGLLGFDLLSHVQIIGRPNTGLWYYTGFVLGLCAYPGAGAGGSQS